MAFNAEQLNIVLSAQTKDLRRELANAEKRIKNFEAKSKQSLGGAGREFQMLAGAAKRFAPIAAGAFSAQALTDAMQYAQEIENLARLSGTGVERFQEMAFAANKFGVQQDKLADILKDTNDKLGDFFQTGAGPMADFFENIAPKVGVTADSFRKLSGPDALQLYVDSLQKAGLSQSEMTFYMEALASDSALLTPLLADNGAEMERLGGKARALGIVLDEDLIRQTSQMNEVWATVMKTMSTNFTRFAAYVVTGFDNIFGITLSGELNKARRSLEDVQDEIASMEGQMKEAQNTGVMFTEDGLGVYSLDNATEALARLRKEEQEYQMQVDEAMGLLDKLQKAKDDVANTPAIGTTTGAGSASKDLESARRAWESLLGSIDATAKANMDFASAQAVVNDAVKAGIATQEQANVVLGVIKQRYDIAREAAIDFSSVASTIETGFEDAFMSVLDGTENAKDAFRSMARQIIAELYRVLVVQRLVGSLGTASTAGSGILGAIGSAFPSLKGAASGRYVQAGQPTTVGEHGRELFVPPVNGRILNAAQAQNMANSTGGGVTVNQNITFGSGVSRAEIQQMLPKIVEASKAAILDAKRRGGSYGGAF